MTRSGDHLRDCAAHLDAYAEADVSAVDRKILADGLSWQLAAIIGRQLWSSRWPRHLESRFPDAPWRAVRLLHERDLATERGLAVTPTTMLLASTNDLRALATGLRGMANEIEEGAVTNPPFPGLLGSDDGRGGFIPVTLRVPAAALEKLEVLMREVYADLPPPTVEAVREALARVEDRLRAAGVNRILLYGSVAQGSARPDSDVDLAYESATPLGLREWSDLMQALADAAGRPVDLQTVADLRERAQRDAVEVWTAGEIGDG
ncbi:nucleotidyltransferase family protein [Azospirillum brasilense]|uniref:Nucleotidyltransferase domain-containing protein n=1 Tax=Azospirillum brasilense TaxID=192 RepID=A0A6L3ART3_AZOBR|nr:nucleotidyltransferase domain-containing protein [Azospirillum brasilense]KAA0676743.1 nucleotidyltransferase domain-containing protein [Azospirillum brasilense]